IEVEVGDHQLVLVAARLREDLPARIAEVRLTVELADLPRRFDAYAVDRADEIAVGDGVRRLLELPQILGEPGQRGARIEHDLGAIQSQGARSLGEVAVVTDVDADFADGSLEHGIAEVARTEIELLPETGRGLRDVVLAILAEIL